MVSIEYIIESALAVDSQMADAFLKACGVKRRRRSKAARPPAPEYRGLRQCFRNFGSPLDGRI